MNRSTESSVWNSSPSESDNIDYNISSASTETEGPDMIRKTSYHIFGREYEFYDQLVSELSEENVSGENIDISDSRGIMPTNSTNLLPNVHLVLVTTETPETQEWRKRILEEEIKLLRLKQKLIQHQVMITLYSLHLFLFILFIL